MSIYPLNVHANHNVSDDRNEGIPFLVVQHLDQAIHFHTVLAAGLDF